jgi:hypothetical protein
VSFLLRLLGRAVGHLGAAVEDALTDDLPTEEIDEGQALGTTRPPLDPAQHVLQLGDDVVLLRPLPRAPRRELAWAVGYLNVEVPALVDGAPGNVRICSDATWAREQQRMLAQTPLSRPTPTYRKARLGLFDVVLVVRREPPRVTGVDLGRALGHPEQALGLVAGLAALEAFTTWIAQVPNHGVIAGLMGFGWDGVAMLEALVSSSKMPEWCELYRPPEELFGACPADNAARDVWIIGQAAHVLLAGDVFSADERSDLDETIAALLQRRATNPHHNGSLVPTPAGLPLDVADFITSCLSFDPARRPRDAQAAKAKVDALVRAHQATPSRVATILANTFPQRAARETALYREAALLKRLPGLRVVPTSPL